MMFLAAGMLGCESKEEPAMNEPVDEPKPVSYTHLTLPTNVNV